MLLTHQSSKRAQNTEILVASIALLILIYFPVFYKLSSHSIYLYDESRLAFNALEMHVNGGYLVPKFLGSPEMWCTKPPLLVWMQVICFKLAGVGELGLRLPVGLSAFFTCIFLLWFSVKYIKSFWFGFIVVLLLITTNGYIEIHGARTGDYDVVLTLFTTIYCLSFFLFLETNKDKYLHVFFLALTLAMYTKGVQALLFLPALALYIGITKRYYSVFKNKLLYVDGLASILLIGTYYLTREYFNPGYLSAVWNNEIGGRYLHIIEYHKHQRTYYLEKIIGDQFKDWFWAIPCGVAIGAFCKDTRLKRLVVFSAVLVSVYLLIISFAQTRISWYSIPTLPFLCIICAVFFYSIFNFLNQVPHIEEKLRFNVLPIIYIFLLFLVPYSAIINKIVAEVKDDNLRNYYKFHYFNKSIPSDSNHFFSYDGYDAHLSFYAEVYKLNGKNFGYKSWEKLKVGDYVICNQKKVEDYLKNNYKVKIDESHGDVRGYKILAEQAGK